jgi:hypothetical protein
MAVHIPRSDWPPKRVKFALCYARGRTLKEAALAVGIHRNTCYLWLQDKGYRLYVDTIRDLVMEDNLNRLVRLVARSIKAQSELLSSEDEAIKLAASRAIQDSFFRFTSAVVTNRRLSSLELARLADEEGPGDDDGQAEARASELIAKWLRPDGPAPSETNGDGHG